MECWRRRQWAACQNEVKEILSQYCTVIYPYWARIGDSDVTFIRQPLKIVLHHIHLLNVTILKLHVCVYNHF